MAAAEICVPLLVRAPASSVAPPCQLRAARVTRAWRIAPRVMALARPSSQGNGGAWLAHGVLIAPIPYDTVVLKPACAGSHAA